MNLPEVIRGLLDVTFGIFYVVIGFEMIMYELVKVCKYLNETKKKLKKKKDARRGWSMFEITTVTNNAAVAAIIYIRRPISSCFTFIFHFI